MRIPCIVALVGPNLVFQLKYFFNPVCPSPDFVKGPVSINYVETHCQKSNKSACCPHNFRTELFKYVDFDSVPKQNYYPLFMSVTAKAESSENRSASDYSLYFKYALIQSTSVRTGRPLILKHLNTGRGRAKKFGLGLGCACFA